MSSRGSATFSIIPDTVLDAMAANKLSPQAVALYAVLASYANRESGQAWPSRTTLARRLGRKKPDSIDKYVGELVAAGILSKEARYGNRAESVSDVRDDTHQGRLSNRYTLLTRHTPAAVDRGEGYPSQRARATPKRGQGVTRRQGHEQEVIQQESKTRGSRSVAAGAQPAELPSWLVSGNRPEDVSPFSPPKQPLPGNWRPKADEQQQAQRLGLNVEDLARQFRRFMVGHERSDWDMAFEWFINDVAAQRNLAILPLGA